uniref:Uncharacterized protein n=1 Tax=Oncorhynchus tshawytscha TaxID=74940 RepID=A0AAZ3QQI2_ONCTS
ERDRESYMRGTRLGVLNTVLRYNLHRETQKVVVFMIMMLLIVINVVLMFLLAFQ